MLYCCAVLCCVVLCYAVCDAETTDRLRARETITHDVAAADNETPMVSRPRPGIRVRRFYQYSLSSAGEHPGWAIGRSVGSVCTDDWGYCSFDHTPAGCCTHSTGCTRYWAKQTLRTWDCSNSLGCPGPECTVERNGGCPDRRVTPDLVAKAALWTVMHQSTSSVYVVKATAPAGI